MNRSIAWGAIGALLLLLVSASYHAYVADAYHACIPPTKANTGNAVIVSSAATYSPQLGDTVKVKLRPFPPYSLSARRAKGTITVRWTTGNSDTGLTYAVYRCTTGNAWNSVWVGQGSEFVDRDIRSGSAYSYYVTIRDENGESDPSSAVQVLKYL